MACGEHEHNWVRPIKKNRIDNEEIHDDGVDGVGFNVICETCKARGIEWFCYSNTEQIIE